MCEDLPCAWDDIHILLVSAVQIQGLPGGEWQEWSLVWRFCSHSLVIGLVRKGDTH